MRGHLSGAICIFAQFVDGVPYPSMIGPPKTYTHTTFPNKMQTVGIWVQYVKRERRKPGKYGYVTCYIAKITVEQRRQPDIRRTRVVCVLVTRRVASSSRTTSKREQREQREQREEREEREERKELHSSLRDIMPLERTAAWPPCMKTSTSTALSLFDAPCRCRPPALFS